MSKCKGKIINKVWMSKNRNKTITQLIIHSKAHLKIIKCIINLKITSHKIPYNQKQNYKNNSNYKCFKGKSVKDKYNSKRIEKKCKSMKSKCRQRTWRKKEFKYYKKLLRDKKSGIKAKKKIILKLKLWFHHKSANVVFFDIVFICIQLKVRTYTVQLLFKYYFHRNHNHFQNQKHF